MLLVLALGMEAIAAADILFYVFGNSVNELSRNDRIFDHYPTRRNVFVDCPCAMVNRQTVECRTRPKPRSTTSIPYVSRIYTMG